MKSYPFSALAYHGTACTEVVSVAVAMFVGLALACLTSLQPFASGERTASADTIVQVVPVTSFVTTTPLVANAGMATTVLITGKR